MCKLNKKELSPPINTTYSKVILPMNQPPRIATVSWIKQQIRLNASSYS